MRSLNQLLLMPALALASGCGEPGGAKEKMSPPKATVSPTATPRPAATPKKRYPTGPAFSRRRIQVGRRTLNVEVANTDAERAFGLMYRESMPEDHGMLFVFESEQQLSFWMKNTLIPLSIAYINSDLRIVDIQEMVPASDLEMMPNTYPSRAPAKYALEMNKGWFAKNKIKVGERIRLL